MIYTIGNGDSYRRGIKELGEKFEKVGRNNVSQLEHIPNNYPGGYAFLTKEDAELRISEIVKESGDDHGLEPFGLMADWEEDTVESMHGWWHCLLKNSLIVGI